MTSGIETNPQTIIQQACDAACNMIKKDEEISPILRQYPGKEDLIFHV